MKAYWGSGDTVPLIIYLLSNVIHPVTVLKNMYTSWILPFCSSEPKFHFLMEVWEFNSFHKIWISVSLFVVLISVYRPTNSFAQMCFTIKSIGSSVLADRRNFLLPALHNSCSNPMHSVWLWFKAICGNDPHTAPNRSAWLLQGMVHEYFVCDRV